MRDHNQKIGLTSEKFGSQNFSDRSAGRCPLWPKANRDLLTGHV